jgi:2,3-bisphosphoglycerate-dependent phosphoglycerate mutase
MKKLVLLRHGESQWNLENRFTGWTDVDLSAKGIQEAECAGTLLKDNGYQFDTAFVSYLTRAQHTLEIVLAKLEEPNISIHASWKLNERHYGALQGLNKADTAAKYGEEQVRIWRRSYDIRPPLLSEDDERNPKRQELYKDVDPSLLPLGESLEDTVARVIPYFNAEIRPLIDQEERVLIAAHGNSLRALMMHLDHLSKEEIVSVNIPTGAPLVYEFDDDGNTIRHMYLGNADEIAAKMQSTADQGKAK